MTAYRISSDTEFFGKSVAELEPWLESHTHFSMMGFKILKGVLRRIVHALIQVL